MPAPATVWVDRLSRAAVRAAARVCRQRGIRRVEYFELGPEDGALALRAAARSGLHVTPIEYELWTFRDASGLGLRYAVAGALAEKLPPSLARRLLETGLADSLDGFPPGDVRVALIKAAADLVAPAVAVALLAAAARGQTVLLIDADASVLAGDWPAFAGHHIEIYGDTSRALDRILFALRAWGRAWRELAGMHLRGIVASDRRSAPAKVAVQLHPPAEREPISYPWYDRSGIEGPRICVYSDRPDVPFTAGVAEAIDREGHEWIAFRGLRLASRGARVTRPYLARFWAAVRESLSLVAHAARAPHPFAAWETGERMALLWRVVFWEALFKRHRIAALVQYAETGRLMTAQAIAVRRAGGIMVGWHWSHYQFVSVAHARCHSVFFSWGPYYRPILEGEGSQIDHLIYTGHLALRTGKPTQALDRRVRASGADYVLCFFDSSFGGLAYSRRAMIALYERLLTEVASTPGFGLVIKPKNAGVPGDLTELAGPLAAARATGRLFELAADAPVRDAIGPADLVLGYGINTAGIEAAIEGKPVIHADLDGAATYPWYEWGRDRVVFDTIEGVMAAVRFHRASGGGLAQMADHRPILRQLDPFGDGDGHTRVGRYLKMYLDGIDAGLPASEALGRATAAYAAQHGAMRVSSLQPSEQRRRHAS